MGTPVMWMLLPHWPGPEVAASLAVAAVGFVLRRTAPRHRRHAEDAGREETR